MPVVTLNEARENVPSSNIVKILKSIEQIQSKKKRGTQLDMTSNQICGVV